MSRMRSARSVASAVRTRFMAEKLSITEMVMTSNRKHCRNDKVKRFLDHGAPGASSSPAAASTVIDLPDPASPRCPASAPAPGRQTRPPRSGRRDARSPVGTDTARLRRSRIRSPPNRRADDADRLLFARTVEPERVPLTLQTPVLLQRIEQETSVAGISSTRTVTETRPDDLHRARTGRAPQRDRGGDGVPCAGCGRVGAGPGSAGGGGGEPGVDQPAIARTGAGGGA